MKLVLTWILFVGCYTTTGTDEVDWTLHQKFRMLEESIVDNKDLPKFIHIQHGDNYVFANDPTKTNRSYDNIQCIGVLQWMQWNIQYGANKWAFDSKIDNITNKKSEN